MKRVMFICFILALIAALGYFLMGMGIIQPGSYDLNSDPVGITWIAGSCYIVGGLVIFLKRRALWILGLAVNALVIVFFYARYIHQPDVIASAPGLITKISQILLEAGLIYLVVKFKKPASAK
jgi:hypothetical protein